MKPQDPTTKIAEIKENNAEFFSKVAVDKMEIVDENSQRDAVEILAQIKTRIKRIEELRKQFTTPLNDHIKTMNNMFRVQSEPLGELERAIKGKIVIYMEAQEEKARKKAAKLAEKAKKSDKPMMEPVEAPKASVRTDSGMATMRKTWDFEIENRAKLMKMRPELFLVDPTAIRRLINAGERKIPGLKIFEKSSIAVR